MSEALWLNPAFGVSGDMLLGAMFGVGADVSGVRDGLSKLELDGWALQVETVERRGIRSTRAVVKAELGVHRPWSEIDELLASSALPEKVIDGSRRTFRLLGEIEADVHGVRLDEVRFHEVGAVDAIVDIVGTWLAIEQLGVEEVSSASIGVGSGSLGSMHGGLPNPGPAVMGLLRGLPVTGVDVTFETVTPTGAALLSTVVGSWGPLPDGTVIETGLGAGAIDAQSHANVVAAMRIRPSESARTDAVVLETNVDDVAPEVLAHVVEAALALGADDAWIAPIVMKKGRSAHQIGVLSTPALAPDITQMLARETGTLGIRAVRVAKHVFVRSHGSVEVDGFVIAIKDGPYGAKPEFDDVRRVAELTGRTLADVSRAALARWQRVEDQ